MKSKAEAKSLAGWKAMGCGKLRFAKAGESFPLPQVGLPGFRISGRKLQVMEYEDGTLVPVIPHPAGLIRAIVFTICSTHQRELRGPEFRFLRRHLGLSQEDLAEHLGLRRETLSKYENSVEAVDRRSELALRGLALLSLLNSLPTKEREGLFNAMQGIQDGLTRTFEKVSEKAVKIPIPGADKTSILWDKAPSPQKAEACHAQC